jgi:hypothetical protein
VRDLGVLLTLQPSKASPLNIFKLEAGLFAGNGIKPQFTSHMDFIGHLSVTQLIGDNSVVTAGVSAYLGGTLQRNPLSYVMKDNVWTVESDTKDNIGKYAKRRYFGFDAQWNIISAAGLTQVRGEYISGEHPGELSGAYPFNFNSLPPETPVYMRKINGGYVILTQDVGKTPFSAVLKYDWYNPNTQIAGNDIQQGQAGEITMSNIGVGLYWRINPALRLTAYYDIVMNETTDRWNETKDQSGKVTAYGYNKNRKDNVFTLRLQYRF